MSSNFLKFGRYEGLWNSPHTDAEFEIVIDEDNFHPFDTEKHGLFAFEGFFEWRIIAGKDYEECIGKQAMEKVRGFYFNYFDGYKQKIDIKDEYHFICLGYELVEQGDKRFLGHDAYNILLDPKLNKLETMTLGHPLQWDNPLTIYRTASKQELNELLYKNQYLKEEGIVGIISDYLHYFEKPTTARFNKWSFNRKLKVMDKRMHPLFMDLEYCSLEKE